jgi:hypothetical protein
MFVTRVKIAKDSFLGCIRRCWEESGDGEGIRSMCVSLRSLPWHDIEVMQNVPNKTSASSLCGPC